ncbi:MAG: type I glyceraldehyde-3-phosphate dehydrogenase [Deltaproteobacteria bacterium]|nr:type I glyceraldehyde-3-phosphate dehydrogenase [Deltaproteobacteria bacterium]
MSIRVGINGFGRIGRRVLRAVADDKDFQVVAINDLTDAKVLAHLLKYDSVHGRFSGSVEVRDKAIVVNGREIAVLALKDPGELPWKELEADIVLESTGRFVDRESASRHLSQGAKKVLISAPAKDEDITIAVGINEKNYDPKKHHVISNASCTTNCLAPVAKVLHEGWGIERGLMTTIHSYTNDQRILDLPHTDLRRARAAAVSMIPTTTGAAKAVSLVLPELKGKLDGMAIRTPNFNVSVVDLTASLARPATAEDINAAFRKAAAGPLKGILAVSDEPLVSIDYNGDTHSSTVDALSTRVIDGTLTKVLAWYDNETGYAQRCVDLIRYIAKSL